MQQPNLEKSNNFSDTNVNDGILELIKDIKEFEKKFEKYNLKKIEVKEEKIESEPENLEEFQPIDAREERIEAEPEVLEEFQSIEEIKEPIFKDDFKNLEPELETEKEKIKSINPATFRIRFNDEGKFENVDVVKRKLKTKSKKQFILKRIKIRRKEKTESEETEEKSRFSKLKTGLSKLKSIIPNRSTEIENAEETEKEE